MFGVRNLLTVESVSLRRNNLAAASIIFLHHAFRNLVIEERINVEMNLDDMLKNKTIMLDVSADLVVELIHFSCNFQCCLINSWQAVK